MIRQIPNVQFYNIHDQNNFYNAMRKDVQLLLDNKAYLSLATVVVCCLDALAAGSGYAGRAKFIAFVEQHFPQLCTELHATYPRRDGADTLYREYRNGFAHIRSPRPKFAIVENYEIDGAWAEEFAINGMGTFVGLNVDRLGREFLLLLDKLESQSKGREK